MSPSGSELGSGVELGLGRLIPDAEDIIDGGCPPDMPLDEAPEAEDVLLPIEPLDPPDKLPVAPPRLSMIFAADEPDADARGLRAASSGVGGAPLFDMLADPDNEPQPWGGLDPAAPFDPGAESPEIVGEGVSGGFAPAVPGGEPFAPATPAAPPPGAASRAGSEPAVEPINPVSGGPPDDGTGSAGDVPVPGAPCPGVPASPA